MSEFLFLAWTSMDLLISSFFPPFCSPGHFSKLNVLHWLTPSFLSCLYVNPLLPFQSRESSCFVIPVYLSILTSPSFSLVPRRLPDFLFFWRSQSEGLSPKPSPLKDYGKDYENKLQTGLLGPVWELVKFEENPTYLLTHQLAPSVVKAVLQNNYATNSSMLHSWLVPIVLEHCKCQLLIKDICVKCVAFPVTHLLPNESCL